MAIHLTPEANPTVQEGTLYVDSATGEFNVAGRTTPHIIPGVLYPAYVASGTSPKLLDGTTTHGTGTYNGVAVSTAYGTVQADGRKYYYTNIAGSKPIKDPRIGGHFGSQRHKFKSTQLLEQETAIHGDEVYSVDGRDWIRRVGKFNVHDGYGTQGHFLGHTTTTDATNSKYFEIVGYFNAVNYLSYTHSNRDINVFIDGTQNPSSTVTAGTTSVDNPLANRYVDSANLINIPITGLTTPGIHTLKIANVNGDYLLLFGIELIAQDTSNRNNIQIPSQNVVSYGKKFTVSAEGSSGHHYNPFNGYTATTSFSSVVDVDTSLGLEAWKHTDNNYYPPVNGGRVVKWVDSSGVIKTSVTLMPPNATGIGSFSSNPRDPNYGSWSSQYQPTFKNETERQLHEVAKTFHWREFGNGSANGGTGSSYLDASMLDTNERNIAYVMDDGLTSVAGDQVYKSGAYGLLRWDTGSKIYFTFIGTGLTWNTSTLGIKHWAQNLPYGTHIVELETSSTSSEGTFKIDGVTVKSDFANSGDLHIYKWHPSDDITFHQPKKPPIPEDACVIADYMLMADFVPQTSAGVDHISKGVRRVDISRDIFFDKSDGTAVPLAFDPASWLGGRLRMDLGGTASSDTSCTIKLPAFGDNYVIRGYDVNDTLVPYIGGVSKASDSTFHNGTVYGSYAHLTNNLTDLGTYSFEANFKQSERGYATEIEIATPIHTSFHYTDGNKTNPKTGFETPFLHELVGGDRNMEQTNLVVSPDGKTWDQLTRDTSYIGDGVLFTRNGNSYGGDTNVHINDDWRGKEEEKNFYNKDFAIAYDRVICLKDGQYVLHFQTYRNEGGDRDIYLNGAVFVRSYQIDAGTGTSQATVQLKRGDYLQTVGRQSTNNYVNFFWIKKA